MADSLLDNYNPLYDVHLRQYFALPHMQKHLRNIGLLQGDDNEDCDDETQLYARHHAMMDLMLRNRETQLAKLADVQKKLDAAEKVEICRKIRSGATSPESHRRSKPSRRRFSASKRQRRSSTSTDDKDLIKKIETENEEPQTGDPHYVYNRLSACVGKYRYLHKVKLNSSLII
uniref:DMAP1 domain-containing protein n=1 Tax=Ascaris lumbricoides TaxID=6252 RepID=A0A0M3ILY2_ASCLU